MTGGAFALVPVKDPAQGKSRLADLLSESERLALNRSLAQRTFECCAAAFGSQRTVVVTTAEAMAAEASARGLMVVREGSGGGLNAALALAARHAISQGAGALVVVPVDLVLLKPEAFQRVIASLMDAPGCVLVPDRHGAGTNVLGLMPARADLFRFGERSLDKHRRAAAEAGLTVRTRIDPALALDLDTPEDYHLWRGVGAAGSNG